MATPNFAETEGSKAISLVSAINEAFAASSTPQQVLDLVLDKLLEVLAVDCCWAQMLDRDSGKLILAAQRGFTPQMVEEIASIELGQSLAGQVALSGQPIMIPELAADPRYTLVSLTEAGLRSFAAVPLKLGNRTLGVVGIASRTASKFTMSEVQLLRVLASQIAIVIDRISLYLQARESEEQLTLVNRLSRIITSSLDINEVYEAFADEIRKLMDADWASIVLIKEKELQFYALSSKIPSAWKPGDTIPLEGTATAWVAATKRALTEPDLAQERKFWTGEIHLKHGIRSIVYLPLLAKGEAFGALIFATRRPNAYGERETALLEHVAAQIAMPIENARLFEQSKQRRDLLASINHITRIISSDISLNGVYQAFVQELRKLVDFDRLSVALVEANKARFFAVAQDTTTELRAGRTYPLEDSDTYWVLKHKKTLVQPNLTQQRVAPIDDIKLEEGLRSSIHVPLFNKGEVFGTLNLSSFQPNTYGQREQEILEQLTAQIAGAIYSAHLYAKAERRATTDELTGLFNRRYFEECLRQEIDRHSRYGDILSLIILDLDLFKTYNDMHGHSAGDKLLSQIGRLIKRSVRRIDLPFRYGGDEFAVLLPQISSKDAYIVAERVRTKIATRMRTKQIPVTASFGLASWPGDGATPDALRNSADQALYYAKRTGGNRTSIAGKTLVPLTEPVISGTEAERGILGIIYALVATVEARDPYTYGHSQRVNKYAIALAEALGLPSERIANLSAAALLHDIGKVGIPNGLLRKVGNLDAQEWEMVQSHVRLAASIVGRIPSLTPCLPAILHHHERWDGTGYPSGLKGEAIPIEARILAIADVLEAITSSRSYRGALSLHEAVEELKRGAGSQFDPKLVEAFLPIALSTAPEEIGAVEDSGSSKSDS